MQQLLIVDFFKSISNRVQQEMELKTVCHRSSSMIDTKLSYDGYQISPDQKEKSEQMRLQYSKCATTGTKLSS